MPQKEEPVCPGIYRHYKGQDYEVMGVAIHTENEEEHVVYRALYGDYRLFVRPKSMFVEGVEKGDYKGPRFRLEQAF